MALVSAVVTSTLEIYKRLESLGIVEFHYQKVGVQFFQDLITSEAWLRDEHVNITLHLMCICMRLHPNLFEFHVAIIDSFF
ncbi:hypothetical protein FNV43_RR10440 [Rhamnella rubrinervis]|uniref:Uncharacterized protein n=1 Tax=Rhamnella rubrinervis TaxID=2594499 RepID=A0A8K0HCM5_9ROSA|nr:hypothetical protein FNV43_RR10440 [Rhamnella rubrinervis]